MSSLAHRWRRAISSAATKFRRAPRGASPGGCSSNSMPVGCCGRILAKRPRRRGCPLFSRSPDRDDEMSVTIKSREEILEHLRGVLSDLYELRPEQIVPEAN